MEQQTKRTVIVRSTIAVSMLLFLVSLYCKVREQGADDLDTITGYRTAFWITVTITFVLLIVLTLIQLKWYAGKTSDSELEDQ